MKLETLLALGAEVACGAVALHQYPLGRMQADGTVLLTPDGEQRVAETQAALAALRGGSEAGAKAKGLKGKKEAVQEPQGDPVDPDAANPLEGAGA